MPDSYTPSPDDRFTFGLWTVGNPGRDPFGHEVRPPLDPVDTVHHLAELGAYGVNFHDDDLVPPGSSPAEREAILKRFRRALDDTGMRVPMATTNLFSRPMFKEGAFTANDPAVRRFAIAKTLDAIELGAELGATTYVMWGGREGVEADAAKDVRAALDRYAEAVNICCAHVLDRGYEMRFALEPKPNEPRGDLFLPTVGHALAFIGELEWPDMVGLNPEFAHETMSGLSFHHAVAQCLWQRKLFHIDLNGQRIGKFDQDFRFGSEGIRDAFYLVKLLEESGWDGMRHFDAHAYRTEDADGVWDFARGCMRTYLILRDKARPLRRRRRDPGGAPRRPGRPVGGAHAARRPRARGHRGVASRGGGLRRTGARQPGLRPRAARPARDRAAARRPLARPAAFGSSRTGGARRRGRQLHAVDEARAAGRDDRAARGVGARAPSARLPAPQRTGPGGVVGRARPRGRRRSAADRSPPWPSAASSTGWWCSTREGRWCGRRSSGTTPSRPRTPPPWSSGSAPRRGAGRWASCRWRRTPSRSWRGCGAASPRRGPAWLGWSCPTTGSTSGAPGVAATDRGDASGTGYWSAATGEWRPDLLALIDDDRDWARCLPEVRAPAEPVGRLVGEARDLFGPALVAPGTGDNMAAALGLGLAPGDVAISVGTSGTVYAVSETAVADPDGRGRRVRRRDRSVPPARLHAERSQGARHGRDPARDRPRRARRAGARRAAGARGLTLLPYLDGERTPNRPDATGTLAGLRTLHDRADLARAAVEGVVHGLLDGLDALDAQGVTTDHRLVLTGGGARSRAVRRVLADLSGRPVEVHATAEMVARGAAVQAAAILAGAEPMDVSAAWRPRADDAGRA